MSLPHADAGATPPSPHRPNVRFDRADAGASASSEGARVGVRRRAQWSTRRRRTGRRASRTTTRAIPPARTDVEKIRVIRESLAGGKVEGGATSSSSRRPRPDRERPGDGVLVARAARVHVRVIYRPAGRATPSSVSTATETFPGPVLPPRGRAPFATAQLPAQRHHPHLPPRVRPQPRLPRPLRQRRRDHRRTRSHAGSPRPHARPKPRAPHHGSVPPRATPGRPRPAQQPRAGVFVRDAIDRGAPLRILNPLHAAEARRGASDRRSRVSPSSRPRRNRRSKSSGTRARPVARTRGWRS